MIVCAAIISGQLLLVLSRPFTSVILPSLPVRGVCVNPVQFEWSDENALLWHLFGSLARIFQHPHIIEQLFRRVATIHEIARAVDINRWIHRCNKRIELGSVPFLRWGDETKHFVFTLSTLIDWDFCEEFRFTNLMKSLRDRYGLIIINGRVLQNNPMRLSFV